MGETRVDLVHLLEDLRDAYAGPIEETILTEAVANGLDSGAGHVSFLTDAAASTIAIVDDGSGMRRRDLARYHDLATSTKTRGDGIGFAGVGIKLGLLVCREVTTETRRGTTHVASTWRLASRRRAPWKWVPPPGLVRERGTAVRLALNNPLSPLLDPGFLDQTLRRHFMPLLDGAFDDLLSSSYPEGVRFALNGVPMAPEQPRGERVPVAIRVARRRKPVAVGYLARHESQLSEEEQGVAISTFGKVIKRGWEWTGLSPVAAARIDGLIEAPALAGVLTLNKADFIRGGTRGAMYLTYRKAIQEAIARQLAEWGDGTDTPPERPRPLRIPDLEDVLQQLATAFPLLGALVERRRGGQSRLPLASRQAALDLSGETASALTAAPVTGGPAESDTPPPGGSPRPPEPATQPPPASGTLDSTSTSARRRSGRLGLEIRFESRHDNAEVARLVESTVWINDAHPAYRRALASRSVGYHLMLSVILALAPLTVEPAREHQFITAFLREWGEALDKPSRRRAGRVRQPSRTPR